LGKQLIKQRHNPSALLKAEHIGKKFQQDLLQYEMDMGNAKKLKEWCAGKEAELPKPHVLLSPSSPAKHDKKTHFNTACEAGFS
jgi:hypothetical protein